MSRITRVKLADLPITDFEKRILAITHNNGQKLSQLSNMLQLPPDVAYRNHVLVWVNNMWVRVLRCNGLAYYKLNTQKVEL